MYRIAAMICSAAIVFLASACGQTTGSGDRTDKRDDIQLLVFKASRAAEEQRSARVTTKLEMHLPPSQGGGIVYLRGAGVLRFDPPLGALDHSFAGSPSVDEFVDDWDSMKTIIDGDSVYVSSPDIAKLTRSRKSWIKMDSFEESRPSTGTEFLGVMPPHPSLELARLRGATEVEEVGEEHVRGEETTHYSGISDYEALKRTDPETAAAVERWIDLRASSKLPFEVWITKEGLPARYEVEYELTGSSRTPAIADLTFTVEYFDWGTPVKVDKPPPSKVIDVTELRAPNVPEDPVDA